MKILKRTLVLLNSCFSETIMFGLDVELQSSDGPEDNCPLSPYESENEKKSDGISRREFI
jgi:hypothetical protein